MPVHPAFEIDADIIERMQDWRHDFHRHPETGFEEFRTADIVAEALGQMGYEVHRGIARTGIVAVLRNGEGPSIGLRAELDALDMLELGNPPYKSEIVGKMHGCGHDGHMAMLLGTATYLARHKPFAGTVHLIFQPAEENLAGGEVMIAEGLFDRFDMDSIFAVHNMPMLPLGQIGLIYGPAAAAYDNFEIEITGKGGHGAMPDACIDPIVIAAQLVSALQTIVSRNLGGLDAGIVSVTRIHGGETSNVIPETTELAGTVRTFDPAIRDRIEKRMGEICDGLAAMHGAGVNLGYRRGYPCLVNAAEQTDIVREVAASQLGADSVIVFPRPVMGSEDFAFMLQKRPGCYALLGSGKSASDPAPHNPYFNFNDDALPIGAALFVGLVQRLLPLPG